MHCTLITVLRYVYICAYICCTPMYKHPCMHTYIHTNSSLLVHTLNTHYLRLSTCSKSSVEQRRKGRNSFYIERSLTVQTYSHGNHDGPVATALYGSMGLWHPIDAILLYCKCCFCWRIEQEEENKEGLVVRHSAIFEIVWEGQSTHHFQTRSRSPPMVATNGWSLFLGHGGISSTKGCLLDSVRRQQGPHAISQIQGLCTALCSGCLVLCHVRTDQMEISRSLVNTHIGMSVVRCWVRFVGDCRGIGFGIQWFEWTPSERTCRLATVGGSGRTWEWFAGRCPPPHYGSMDQGGNSSFAHERILWIAAHGNRIDEEFE